MQEGRRTWQSVGTVELPYLGAAGLIETTTLRRTNEGQDG